MKQLNGKNTYFCILNFYSYDESLKIESNNFNA